MIRTLAILALASLSACMKPSADDIAAQEYAQALVPLLEDNALLAHEVLSLGAAVHDGQVSPDQTAQRWRERVIPLASHLEMQASLVTPPESWAEPHGQLVRVWGARAAAYAMMDDALVARDTRAWNEARNSADQVKLDEEKWFTHIHNELASYGIAVDQYPQLSSGTAP